MPSLYGLSIEGGGKRKGGKRQGPAKDKVSIKTVYRRIYEGRDGPSDRARTSLRKADLMVLSNGTIGSRRKSAAAKKRLRNDPELAAKFRANRGRGFD